MLFGGWRSGVRNRGRTYGSVPTSADELTGLTG